MNEKVDSLQKKMSLTRRVGLFLLYGWFLAATYAFALKRLLLLVGRRLIRILLLISRTLIRIANGIFTIIVELFSGQQNLLVRRVSRLDRIIAMRKRISARAVGELFAYLERSKADTQLFNYFVEKCASPDASTQLISSTAGMAISLGEYDTALELFSSLLARYPLEVSAQQQVGVKAFIAGKYKLAETIWTACSHHREALIVELGLDKYKARFLAPSWLLAIGHIAHLDIYLKHKILNGRADHKTYFSLPAGFDLPNKELMTMWSDYIGEADRELIKGLTPAEIGILQDEFWSLPFEDGQSKMFSHAGAIVQRRWEAEGRAPLLSFDEIDRQKGMEILLQLGVPDGAWFVCLHVRESGFHLKWHKSHPGTRNADIHTYLPAAREIVARGGYVVRLGDASMRSLPVEVGMIDYALSDAKSEFMDIFLCGACKFFIGTNSGLGLVPPIFGVPCAMTNWSPIGLPQWYPKDLFTPKLTYSEPLKRNLTFEEMLFSEAGWLQFEKSLKNAGLQAIDNSPEEITDIVLEMYGEVNLLDSAHSYRSDSLKLFQDMAVRAGSYAGARICMAFLTRHPELIKVSKL